MTGPSTAPVNMWPARDQAHPVFASRRIVTDRVTATVPSGGPVEARGKDQHDNDCDPRRHRTTGRGLALRFTRGGARGVIGSRDPQREPAQPRRVRWAATGIR